MRRLECGIVIGLLACGVIAMRTNGQAAPAPARIAAPPPGVLEPGERGPFNYMLPPPMTKLEAFAAQRGVVVVKGTSNMDVVKDDVGNPVSIAAVQMSNGTDKVAGAAIGIWQVTAYVDEEEIDGLINAIDAIGKLQDGATPFQHSEARYQTSGAVEVSSVVLPDNGARAAMLRLMQFNVSTGQPEFLTAQFPVSRFAELGQRLSNVKDTLARIKSAPAATK